MALEIFKLVGSIFVDNEKANESIQKTDEKAQSLGETFLNGVSTVGEWAIGLTSAAVAVGGAMFGMAEKSAESLDEIQKGAQQLGMSYEAYQKLAYACDLSGTSIDKLSIGMKNITNTISDVAKGNDKARASYDALGISLTNANGEYKDAETVMQESLLALAEMTDETERNALANDIFGKSYQDLLPLINSGAEGINQMMQEAEDLGIVMSDDAVEAGAQFQDTLTKLQESFESLGTNLGAEFFPIIEEVINFIIEQMPAIRGLIESLAPIMMAFLEGLLPPLMDLAQTLLPVIVELINQILPVLVEVASAVLPVITETLAILGPFMAELIQALLPLISDILEPLLPLLEPITALLQPILDLLMLFIQPLLTLLDTVLPPLIEIFSAFIGVLAEDLGICIEAAVIFINETLIPAFQGAWDKIVEVKDGVLEAWENIKQGIGDAIDGAKSKVEEGFKAIVEAVKAPVNTIIGFINTLIEGINSIQVEIPDWVPGDFGGQTLGFNIPTIPLLAKGGQIDGDGSAIVGEAGAELIDLPRGAKVTPLNRGAGEGGSIEEKMAEMVSLLQELVETMPDAVAEGVSQLNLKWNDRELGRLVKQYE